MYLGLEGLAYHHLRALSVEVRPLSPPPRPQLLVFFRSPPALAISFLRLAISSDS